MAELRFDGRVAVITGAGRGIGKAHARLLASRGCRVVVNDLGTATRGGGNDDGPAQQAVEEIRSAGATAIVDTSDVSTTEGARTLVDRAVREFGRIDIVVNNAGIYELDAFPDIAPENLQRHWAVHVGGAFNVTRQAWKELSAHGGGRVVMTTSTGALGAETMTAYGSAKSGVVGLGRALAQAGRNLGIKVNMVAPLAATRMVAVGADLPEDEIPDGAEQTPDLVSPMVAYLAHDSCSTTGEIFLSGMRRYSRFFVAETNGYVHPENDVTVEDIATHWNEISDAAHGYGVMPDLDSWTSRNARELDLESIFRNHSGT